MGVSGLFFENEVDGKDQESKADEMINPEGFVFEYQ